MQECVSFSGEFQRDHTIIQGFKETPFEKETSFEKETLEKETYFCSGKETSGEKETHFETDVIAPLPPWWFSVTRFDHNVA